MAVVVERGEAGAAADPVGAEPVHEPVRADDLVVAHVVGPARAGRAAAAGSRGPTGRGRGRRRTAGCRARGRSRRGRSPRRPRRDAGSRPRSRRHRVRRRPARRTESGLDRGHRGVGGQVRAWAAVSADGVPVERGRPAVDRGVGTDGREGGVLLRPARTSRNAAGRQRRRGRRLEPGPVRVTRKSRSVSPVPRSRVRLVGDGSRRREASERHRRASSVRAHASRVLTSTRRVAASRSSVQCRKRAPPRRRFGRPGRASLRSAHAPRRRLRPRHDPHRHGAGRGRHADGARRGARRRPAGRGAHRPPRPAARRPARRAPAGRGDGARPWTGSASCTSTTRSTRSPPSTARSSRSPPSAATAGGSWWSPASTSRTPGATSSTSPSTSTTSPGWWSGRRQGGGAPAGGCVAPGRRPRARRGGARAAGITSVSVLTGGCTEEELVEAGTDVVLADLTAFPAWLDAFVAARSPRGLIAPYPLAPVGVGHLGSRVPAPRPRRSKKRTRPCPLAR